MEEALAGRVGVDGVDARQAVGAAADEAAVDTLFLPLRDHAVREPVGADDADKADVDITVAQQPRQVDRGVQHVTGERDPRGAGCRIPARQLDHALADTGEAPDPVHAYAAPRRLSATIDSHSRQGGRSWSGRGAGSPTSDDPLLSIRASLADAPVRETGEIDRLAVAIHEELRHAPGRGWRVHDAMFGKPVREHEVLETALPAPGDRRVAERAAREVPAPAPPEPDTLHRQDAPGERGPDDVFEVRGGDEKFQPGGPDQSGTPPT